MTQYPRADENHGDDQSPTPRNPDGKRAHSMDYIADRAVYLAVMFARKMIREGRFPPKAIHIAANYYGVDFGEVAHYVGQAGGTTSGRRRR